MDLKQHIGLKVRAARLKSSLTQEQLAEAVDKTVETISNIERGHTLTGLDTLERLGRCLNVPMRDFFEDWEEARTVSRSRLELEHRLRDLARSLSDEDVKVAAEIVEVLAKHRRS